MQKQKQVERKSRNGYISALCVTSYVCV